jgi:pimeloyl-ACP methyl ester carboxylesterase
LRRDIGLETHVTDIENVIVSEELGNVVLVGHSYGGMVIGSVADRLRERIVGVVYLDAFIPINGRSLFDNQIERAKRELRDTAKRNGDG